MTTTMDPPTPRSTTAAEVDEPHATIGTTLRADDVDQAADFPRPLRSRTFDDLTSLFGSFVGSFALTFVAYEFILPFDGTVGFFVCWYLAFLAVYLGTTAIGNPRTVVVDRCASAVIQGGAALTALGLISAVSFPFFRGYHALFHVNFFTGTMSGVGPQDPFDKGGVLHAIVGTLVEVGIAVAITLPLGIGAAIYMSEVGGRFSRVVRTVVEAMTALPSIVAGLFIYTVLVTRLHVPKEGLPAGLAIAVMILPIIARAADVVLRVVPAGLREASLALGSSKWQTVWRVVLPTVRPGLATAVILGIARGIGETSPVLLTSGSSPNFEANPFSGQPMNSLPLQTYAAVRSGEPIYIERGMATACVLLMLVLVLFVVARLLARQRIR